jgi:outer membrane beta-barrel protein
MREGVEMNQACRWLLLAAALVLLPQAAYAQKKKPPKGGDAAPPVAAPAAGAGTPVSADADADQPTTAAPAAGAEPPADANAGAVDICQITPDAPQCVNVKEINLNEEAKKPVRAEIYAVEQQYVMKSGRFEIQPYWEFTLNDQFVSHNGPGLALNYYITQVLAVGLNGNFYQGLNEDSDFNFQNRRSARIAVPLNQYQAAADLNFTYVPMYGKFSGFGDFIFNYDAYIDGGVGLIRTRPEAIIDPNNRKFDWNNLINFDVGIGLRVFFSRWLAAGLEVRDMIFLDKIESLTVATGPTSPATAANSPLNPATWYDGGQHFTNNVQLQVGISVFLPTSFDYRLPK